ncbi:MAG: hypothetical protein IIA14_07190, partial [SAR324 cluster bacterium]|nr:hypothetical protein [SAR324 cluster bacterium]
MISARIANEKYDLGKTTLVDEEFSQGSRLFQEAAYKRLLVHQPAIAEDADSNRYLFWKVEEVKEHIPARMEEIREKVESAWKLDQARPLAEKKAAEIAARVALKTESGMITDAVDVAVDGGTVTTTQSVFAGNFTTKSVVTKGVPVVCVKPNSTSPEAASGAGTVESVSVD